MELETITLYEGTRIAALNASWKNTEREIELHDLTFYPRAAADEAVRRWASTQEGIR